MPRISVVMPAYNAESTLEMAVRSILNQEFRDLELVVIDDGSKDKTLELASRFASEDSRVRVLRNPGKGAPSARNFGIEVTDSLYVAAMDSDDESLPGRLLSQSQAMDSDTSLVAVGGSIQWIGLKSGCPSMVTGSRSCHTALKVFSPLCHPTILFRREALVKVGGYDPKLPCADDFNLLARLSLVGAINNLPDILLKYRIHPNQESVLKRHQQTADMLSTLRWYHSTLANRTLSDHQVLLRMVAAAAKLGPSNYRQALRAIRRCALYTYLN